MDFTIPHIQIPKDDELKELVQSFTKVMALRPSVVDLPKDVSVLYVGDLHGYFDYLNQSLKLASDFSADYIVFLGDYVDRGPKQIETLLAIIELALRDEKFIPLRGNHEDSSMNIRYGFYKEVENIYGTLKTATGIFDLFTTLYDFLPLAAVKLDSGSLALHGGIPQDPSLDTIRSIPKPHSKMLFTKDKEKANHLYSTFYQILWNDPQTCNHLDSEKQMKMMDLDRQQIEFYPSPRSRNITYANQQKQLDKIFLFSEGALKEYLKSNNLKRLIRAHESRRGEYEKLWNGSLYHIYSSPIQEVKEGKFLLERLNDSQEVILEVLRPSGEITDTIIV